MAEKIIKINDVVDIVFDERGEHISMQLRFGHTPKGPISQSDIVLMTKAQAGTLGDVLKVLARE